LLPEAGVNVNVNVNENTNAVKINAIKPGSIIDEIITLPDDTGPNGMCKGCWYV
jgi:hypothetical protein